VRRWAAGHRGVDLALPAGAPVAAAAAGTVAFAGPVAGRPVVAVVHPDGVRTTYEPVVPVVRPGQPVVAGEVLGHLGAPTHCDPDACLHWGARRGPDAYLDPLLLLVDRRVRLYPVG
jgi:murein DD-endopeptidase MepM/ murein hydrolase activator NlpD